jgi:GPI mannosyltransferase 3
MDPKTSIFRLPSDLFSRRVLYASLVLHLLAAFFSTGYHHYDEHYQVLEWAGLKLGLTPRGHLAWEYPAQIRSWVQPAFAFVVSRGLEAFGGFNPFWASYVLRSVFALLGWCTTVGLVRCCEFWFPDPKIRKSAVLATCLAWFVPYLHARYSSENGAQIFFLLGMLPLIQWVALGKGTKHPGFLSGAFWGVAFQCRFQAGFLVFPAVLWLLFFGRPYRWVLAKVALGFTLVSLFCFWLDGWGYGNWVFPAIGYFIVNVIQGKANEWGVFPFWYYFERYFVLAPPLSSLLLVGVVSCWILARRFSLSWISFFFVLAHSFVSHKEVRFLFPILPLTPVLAFMAVQKSPSLRSWFLRSPFRFSSPTLWFFNFLFLIPLMLLPTRTEIPFFKVLWREHPAKISILGSNPFRVPGVSAFFYRRPDLEVVEVAALEEGWKGYLVCSIPGTCRAVQDRVGCESLGGSFPVWLEKKIPESLQSRSKMTAWSLYRCL